MNYITVFDKFQEKVNINQTLTEEASMQEQKIKDSKMLRMVNDGSSQADIARKFGVTPSAVCTRKGELRALSQVSGLTKALLEGNKQETAKFDFESVLPLYNYGNPLQTRAMTSNDSRSSSTTKATVTYCILLNNTATSSL